MWLNKISAFISRYRGLPILVAVACVILNFVLQFMPLGWLSTSNLFLHIGVVLGLMGVLLAEAMG